jgi:hypothetical protein
MSGTDGTNSTTTSKDAPVIPDCVLGTDPAYSTDPLPRPDEPATAPPCLGTDPTPWTWEQLREWGLLTR